MTTYNGINYITSMNSNDLRNVRISSYYAIDAGDRTAASAEIANHLSAQADQAHAWRRAAMEALKDGRAIFLRATRAQYVQWDGSHSLARA